jgi:hypothetical protein
MANRSRPRKIGVGSLISRPLIARLAPVFGNLLHIRCTYPGIEIDPIASDRSCQADLKHVTVNAAVSARKSHGHPLPTSMKLCLTGYGAVLP